LPPGRGLVLQATFNVAFVVIWEIPRRSYKEIPDLLKFPSVLTWLCIGRIGVYPRRILRAPMIHWRTKSSVCGSSASALIRCMVSSSHPTFTEASRA